MADPDAMDWSPIPSLRTSRKRSADEMEEEQVDIIYEKNYIPGGWPSTPVHTSTNANYPVLPSTEPSYLHKAKRVCLRAADCFDYVASTLSNIATLLPSVSLFSERTDDWDLNYSRAVRSVLDAGGRITLPSGRRIMQMHGRILTLRKRRASPPNTRQNHTSALVEEQLNTSQSLAASPIVSVIIPEPEPEVPLPDWSIFKPSNVRLYANQNNESQTAMSGELEETSISTPVQRQTQEDINLVDSCTLASPFASDLYEVSILTEAETGLQSSQILSSPSAHISSSPPGDMSLTPSQQVLSELMRATIEAEMEENYNEDPEDLADENIDSQHNLVSLSDSAQEPTNITQPEDVADENIDSQHTHVSLPASAQETTHEMEADRLVPEITITTTPHVSLSASAQESTNTPQCPLSDISSTKPDTTESCRLQLMSPAARALTPGMNPTTPESDISSTKPDTVEPSRSLLPIPTSPESDISSTKPDTVERSRSLLTVPAVRRWSPFAQASPLNRIAALRRRRQPFNHTENLSTFPTTGSEPLTPFKDIPAAAAPEHGQSSSAANSTPNPSSQIISASVQRSPASNTVSGQALQTPSTPVQHGKGTDLIEGTSKLSLSGLVGVAEKVEEEAVTEEVAQPTPKSSPFAAEIGTRMTRGASLELKRLRNSKKYKIVPLSEEWEEKVDKALKEGHDKYATKDLVRVVPPAGSSGTEGWLNDEVINGYLELICKHASKDVRATTTPRYHAFNSFFMNTLMDKTRGPAAVSRWAKKAKIGGKSLKEVEKLIIPINSGAHWTFLLVEPGVKTITYYNSMAGNGDVYRSHMVDWIRAELGVDFVESDWTFNSRGDGPQQSNMSDCGVFAVTSAKQIMLGQDVMGYGAADIPCQRRRIVAELVNGGLLPSEPLEE